MKDKFSTEWTEVVKTTDANPEAEVGNLREKMTYQFRVIAVNKAGPSVPSEHTNTHVCKHKNRMCGSHHRHSISIRVTLLIFYRHFYSETAYRS